MLQPLPYYLPSALPRLNILNLVLTYRFPNALQIGMAEANRAKDGAQEVHRQTPGERGTIRRLLEIPPEWHPLFVKGKGSFRDLVGVRRHWNYA